MLPRDAPEVLSPQPFEKAVLWGRAARVALVHKNVSDLRERHGIEFGRGIHLDHAPCRDRAFQAGERRPCLWQALRQICAMQEECGVCGKEFPVVLQHAQTVTGDLGIGAVDVHDVDAPRRERFVGEPVIQPAGAERQPVSLLERRPAVPAIEKFLRQPERESGVPCQSGNAADAIALRRCLRHRERISVAETERHRCRKPDGRERAIDIGQRGAGFAAEQLERDRSRVFRIDVDRATFQRGEYDCGIAEPWLEGDPRLTGFAGCLRDDFAEDVGLGKALGADREFRGKAIAAHYETCEYCSRAVTGQRIQQ